MYIAYFNEKLVIGLNGRRTIRIGALHITGCLAPGFAVLWNHWWYFYSLEMNGGHTLCYFTWVVFVHSLRDVEQKLLLNYLAVIPPMEIIGLGMFVGLDFWIQICRSEARFPAAWCWYNADDARIAPTSWLTPLVMMARSGPLFRSLCWATAHQLSCVPVFDFWVKKQTSKIKQLFLISFLCSLKCAR